DRDTLRWAREAILLAGGGPSYAGKGSPHWYDNDSFYELLQAAVAMTVRELVATLEGCADPKAGRITAEFKGRAARDLDRTEAARVLEKAQDESRPVNPRRLGGIGRMPGLPAGYARCVRFVEAEG